MASTQSGKSRNSKVAPAGIPESPQAAAPRTRKTIARKPAAPAMDSTQWQQLVATAAYLRAEARGFAGGSPEQDWFEAEAELRAALPGPAK